MHIQEAMAELDLGAEDEIGKIELKAAAELGADVVAHQFNLIIGVAGLGVGGQVIGIIDAPYCVHPKILVRVGLELHGHRKGHVNALNCLARAAAFEQIVLQTLLRKHQTGDKSQVPALAEAQIGDDAQIETGSTGGLCAEDAVAKQKLVAVLHLEVRGVIAQRDPKVVGLFAVLQVELRCIELGFQGCCAHAQKQPQKHDNQAFAV